MRHIDCLFIHPTTHIKNPPKPTGADELAYLVLPVGTLALANLLDKEGFESRIVHTGVEESFNREFSVEELFKKYEATVVGIDLHWYVHSYDAVRIAEIVKQFSNSFVVFGGFTASFFAEEILNEFDSVDAVVRGDAEMPLLELLRRKPQQGSTSGFEEVPNLVYRKGDSLKISKRRYIADESSLNQLDFSSFNLFENFDKYIKLSLSVKSGQFNLNRLGYPCLGRGCTMNCIYCGGGAEAYQSLTGLSTPIYLSKDKVIEQLVRLAEMKVSSVYMGFDPDPSKRDYHKELFSLIRKEKIDIGSQFELWGLSDRSFLREFRRTFSPLYSSLIHSIQSGSERIRGLNVGYYYSNNELFHWLNMAKEELIPVELAFASGLSWETEKHFDETIRLAEKIVEEYPMVLDLYCIPISLEPCSPRSLNPEKYGISLKFHGFIDYYDFFKRASKGEPLPSVLGYDTNYLSESRILNLSKRFYNALHQHMERLQENRII